MPRNSTDLFGRRLTDEYRLRPNLFGCRLERLRIEADGTSKWVRWWGGVKVEVKP